jgi:hypothetical protein
LAEAEFFLKLNHLRRRDVSSSIEVDFSKAFGLFDEVEEEDHDSLHLSFRPMAGRRNFGALGTGIPFLKQTNNISYE